MLEASFELVRTQFAEQDAGIFPTYHGTSAASTRNLGAEVVGSSAEGRVGLGGRSQRGNAAVWRRINADQTMSMEVTPLIGH